MHEIAKWYKKGLANINQSHNKWSCPNGKAMSLLHLSYDIFSIDNIGELSDRIINRLKNKQNFNGARYELFIFSTLIRAGFDLDYCDEVSGENGSVTECIATHRETSQKIYIEGKTRNVKNVLGSNEGKSKKIRLYDKLSDAVKKDVDGVYIVFIDLNIPDMSLDNKNPALKKVKSEYLKLEKYHKDSMPNIIYYTNIPFHYSKDEVIPEIKVFGRSVPPKPKFNLVSRNSIIGEIDNALDKYDFLPKEFNESDIIAKKLLNIND